MKIRRHIQSSGESPSLQLDPLVLTENLVSVASRRLLRGTKHKEVIGLTLVEVVEKNQMPFKNRTPCLVFDVEVGTGTVNKVKNLEKLKELIAFELVCHTI